MNKVTARPGDTVTHGRSKIHWYTVVSLKEYLDSGRQKPEPGRILAISNALKRAYSWKCNHSTRLNGEIVTHYHDPKVLPTADIVFDRDPAVPRLENQKPDEDGMVTGWDGRKVWL